MIADHHADQPIGIVGGTGPAGLGIAARLVADGQPVVIGSRRLERARAAADHVSAQIRDAGLAGGADSGAVDTLVRPGSNRDAAACELVILATNAEHTLEAAVELEAALSGKIVVSMAAAIRPAGRGMQPHLPPAGSIAMELADHLEGARVVAAFQHAPANALAALAHPFPGDVLVCGDDVDAVETVIERFGGIAEGAFHDVGCLANATAVEAMTAVIVSLNMGDHGRYSLRMVRV